MKLRDWAKQQGVSYRTAWRWFHDGRVPVRQMPSGTILAGTKGPAPVPAEPHSVVVYTRVSSSENRVNLDTQADRVSSFCIANG